MIWKYQMDITMGKAGPARADAGSAFGDASIAMALLLMHAETGISLRLGETARHIGEDTNR
jgi:hypothetical protein